VDSRLIKLDVNAPGQWEGICEVRRGGFVKLISDRGNILGSACGAHAAGEERGGEGTLSVAAARLPHFLEAAMLPCWIQLNFSYDRLHPLYFPIATPPLFNLHYYCFIFNC
jgi:hypothetical protein